MLGLCRSIGCTNHSQPNHDFCGECQAYLSPITKPTLTKLGQAQGEQSMAQKYPKYYKPVGELTEVDVYAVHKLFDVQDPSGAIHHASKKLLLSGVRTGGKSPYKDIQEARDTLTRWLQLNDDTQ